MKDNSSVLFYLKPHILWTKIVHRNDIFGLWLVRWKFTNFLMSVLQPRVSFSSNFASFLSVMKHNSFVFFRLNLCMLRTKWPDQIAIFQLSTARTKIIQVPNVIFQATSQFLFKFCITFQCHDIKFLWNFLTETLYALDNNSPSMKNFSDFWLVYNERTSNFSCHFWNHNSASLFSLKKDNSSVFFSSNLRYFGEKNPFKWNFWIFVWLGENSPNSSCHIWNEKSVFIQILNHSSMSRENFSVLF